MSPSDYGSHKRQAAERQREQTATGRDLGALPWVADPARRAAAAGSFRAHCETYHPETFHLGWSDDHLTVIRQIEDAVRLGGLFATAMPRGSGKTSLAEVACVWAAVNGYHPFVCLIGSDEGAAEAMLGSIKTELEVNERLAEDYPEVCLAIAALEGIANRCKGQTYGGARTRIEWTAKEIVLPTLKPAGWPDRDDHRPFVGPEGYSLASGAIIKVAGITGGIRGMKHKRADGKTVRPTLVVPDDPQTDQSARSPSQCETRERILAGAILGLAGPGKRIAGIMPCTVIRAGDMADRILDRNLHPEWHGTRTKMVYAFPRAEKLWEEYARLRADSLKAENDGREATEFYRKHREEMDAGARVAWPDRHGPDELSALQHAMNLRFDRGERAFFAEFQNQPLPEEESRSDDLTPDQIAAKTNRLPRGRVPVACNHLTTFVDVQGTLLYYCVCAWEDDFTGCVIDYGSYPDQKRPYFTLADAKHTLDRAHKGAGLEGRIYAGLEALSAALLGRPWARDDGADLRVGRQLIDANWGVSTPVVRQFCRQSPHSAVLTPSHGKFVGERATPISDWTKRPGDRAGHNWRLRLTGEGRGARSVIYDTNYWKSFVHARLSTAMGDRGCLSLFGEKPDAHRMLADHLTSEFRVRREGQGRTMDEWKLRPERPDNHLFDCVVGCAVAASLLGCSLAETRSPAAAPRRRLTMAEMRDLHRPKP